MLDRHKLACLFLIFSFGSTIASGQVAGGTPGFGSYGGGPFDIVNLANLNVHLPITVFSKAGRGMPFNYTLGYDSSIWYPVGSSGNQSWRNV